MYRQTILLLALCLVALPVWAHHPFADDFDATRPVTLTGEVQSVEWASPHISIHIDVAGRDGNAGEWEMEGASSTTLLAAGWMENTVKEGDRVTIYGYRAKDGSMSGSGRSIVLASGRHMSMSDPLEDGGPAPQLTSTDRSGKTGDESLLAQDRAQPGIEGELPRTATNVPMLAVIGLAAGFGAFALRRRRAVA